MNNPAGNPKPEGRSPTRCARATTRREEGRSPKSESEVVSSQLDITSAIWPSADEKEPSNHILREEPPRGKHPIQRLDERTAQFGAAIIRFAKRIPNNPVNERLVAQLVGADTNVGANYCEADDSVSGKEFKQRIGACRKESKETMFLLRMIASAEPTLTNEARELWREAKELNLIFGGIWRK